MALLYPGRFKANLWENRHNLSRDIFPLGMSPVNPCTSPWLGLVEGAQGGHRAHAPARRLLAQQLRPTCFPSPALSRHPSCRINPPAGDSCALDVSSHFLHSSGTSGCANKNNNKKSYVKRSLTPSENTIWMKEHHLSSTNELLQVMSSCSSCSAVDVFFVVTSLMGPAWAGQ